MCYLQDFSFSYLSAVTISTYRGAWLDFQEKTLGAA